MFEVKIMGFEAKESIYVGIKIDTDHRNPRWLTCMSKKSTFWICINLKIAIAMCMYMGPLYCLNIDPAGQLSYTFKLVTIYIRFLVN